MRYSNIIKDMANKYNFRLRMVKLAINSSVSEAARTYGTSRITVRKWRNRYLEGGARALEDLSRAPKRSPHKTPKKVERKVIKMRKRYPRWGPYRLKYHFDLPCSVGAIGRIIRQAGLIRKRKKKWRQRRDLREKKARMKPFEKIQIDTKDLSDIENYWEAMVGFKLPRFEYTTRDMKTGSAFFAWADANNTLNAGLFAEYVLGHMKRCGMETDGMIVQTDNGSEYIGNVNKKKGQTLFEKTLSRYQCVHEQIPPARPTYNSDVERFHGIVEEELYSCEQFCGEREFIGKGLTYQIYFNHLRPNRWRGMRSPKDTLADAGSNGVGPQILSLPPIRLENLINGLQGGNHLPISVKFRRFLLDKGP